MADTKVAEVMARDAALRIAPDTPVRAAAARMAEHRCGSILVMSGDRLVGIFTERDALFRVVAGGLDPSTTRVADVMTRDPDTIEADAPVADALRKMDQFSYWHLPVTRDGAVVGVVSIRDLPFGGGIGLQDELDTRHRLAERML